MFKKLRNKFLILNLVIISIMMMIAFISIYLITYNNVCKDIDMELHRISKFIGNENPNPNPNRPPPDFDNSPPPPERSVSFTFYTDHEWNIIKISSIFDMEDRFYESAKKAALSKKTDKGMFGLYGNNWTFMVEPDFNGYRMVFLDTTPQQKILRNLIYTFSIVALFTLIFIFFISGFFANKSIEPIKAAFDKQKQFIADASHNLKTPLAVIHTNIDVLLSNGDDRVNNQLKWVYYIKSETERMTKLTNDLLYLTQIDYSDTKMIFYDFNFSEIVENVILTMEAVIFENNISLHYEIEHNLKIHGNSEQLKQVVIILIDNALKYTNTKGSVDVSLKKYYSNIVLSVTNTGEGIAEEHMDKIFDRFYRISKTKNKSGGYGLGLAIAKAIIEQHNGKISAKSVLNKSTTFSIELPCQ